MSAFDLLPPFIVLFVDSSTYILYLLVVG